MTGSTFLLLLLGGTWLAWFVRDRHVKGWRRGLFRRCGYDPVPAEKAAARTLGWTPGGDGGSGGGFGGF